MGKKKRNKDPGGVRQLHPQQSFQQMVGDTTLSKVKGYIDMQLQGMGQALIQRQAQAQQQTFIRIIALEEILMEKFDITKDQLAARVADIQDRSEGFKVVESGVKVGDRVRLEIKIKTAEQKDFQEPSRFMVDNAGSGDTLGKELEDAAVGMVAGETKEVKFGKDKTLTALLSVNKISRKPKPKTAVKNTKTKATEVKTKEVTNADAG